MFLDVEAEAIDIEKKTKQYPREYWVEWRERVF